uniref:Rhodopsin domain-containing protein n=1 Tax=Bionectria ochroleuca TaxID=29856 RepID=A0A8H7K3P4_BIOOC
MFAETSESMKDEASYPGAVPPPPGDIPDLGNPQDASRTLGLAVLIGCDILVTIFFTTRAYVKVRVTHEILLGDVICTIAWASILLYSATFFLMIHYGVGYHAWEVTPEDYSQVLKWLYANSVIYFPTAYFTKITLLLLISRVFAVKRWVTKSIHIFIVVLLAAHLPVQIIKIVICIPIKAYWDPLVDGRCLDQRRIFLFGLSLAIFTDFVILLVPIPLTWSLRVPLRKKIKIMAMLGAGGIATGMTILRMYKAVKFIHSNDVTADFASLVLTTYVSLML